MPEEHLHRIERNAPHSEMRSERVTKYVPRNSSQAGLLAHPLEVIGKPTMVEGLPLCIREHITSQPSLSIQDLVKICIERNRAYAVILWRADGFLAIAVGMPYYHDTVLPIDSWPLKSFKLPLPHTSAKRHQDHLSYDTTCMRKE